MIYNSNGQVRLTIVNGSSYTGLYASDGSWNVVLTTENTTWKGIHNPCGAFWGTITTNPASPFYAIDGSLNIIENIDNSFSPVQPLGKGFDTVSYKADTTFITADNSNMTADYSR